MLLEAIENNYKDGYDAAKKGDIPDASLLLNEEYKRGFMDGYSVAITTKNEIPKEKSQAVLEVISKLSSGVYDDYLKQAKAGNYINLEIPVLEFEALMSLCKNIDIYATVNIV